MFGHLPDEQTLTALENKLGCGRNDYSVPTVWAYIAGIVFQHPSTESLMRELNRNKDLLSLCDFDPLPRRQAKSRRRELYDQDAVLKDRDKEFSADHGLVDSGPLKQMLWDEYPIRPLIDTRAM